MNTKYLILFISATVRSIMIINHHSAIKCDPDINKKGKYLLIFLILP